jgi:hypothetical protein
MLKSEQEAIDREVRQVNDRLKIVDAHLAKWRRVLSNARYLGPHCALGCRKGNPHVRKQFATTVFASLSVRPRPHRRPRVQALLRSAVRAKEGLSGLPRIGRSSKDRGVSRVLA